MNIQIENLVHQFDDGVIGLQNINLLIESGSFVVVAGHNGSGKTLLVRHLVGIEEMKTGTILLDGIPIKTLNDWHIARQKIGFVFQSPEHQILGTTVIEDVEFTPKNRGYKTIAEQTKKVLKLVGLSGYEDRITGFLSGGEKRRLAIASVLIMNPKCIILDEPFNDLDWPGVRELLKILLDLHSQGISIILVTHDLEKCLAHADRLIVMDHGSIALDGKPQDLLSSLHGSIFPKMKRTNVELQSLTWLEESSKTL